jgi:hypothetical protein
MGHSADWLLNWQLNLSFHVTKSYCLYCSRSLVAAAGRMAVAAGQTVGDWSFGGDATGSQMGLHF